MAARLVVSIAHDGAAATYVVDVPAEGGVWIDRFVVEQSIRDAAPPGATIVFKWPLYGTPAQVRKQIREVDFPAS